MSLLGIAWRSLQHRGLASCLTMLSMALGVALCVAVLLTHGILDESFRKNSNLGYNLIVGANKGGKLQLVLNTVFYLSQPLENIKYDYYLEFLTPEEREKELQWFPAADRQAEIERVFTVAGVGGASNLRDPAYAKYIEYAVPVCLGDYLDKFRVIGTTSRFFDLLEYDSFEGLKYEFAQGRNFLDHSPEHGFFEAVLGAHVARELNLKLGDTFNPAHGEPGGHLHEEHPFHVVGILKPTGTPVDRAAYVSMEGFYLMDKHARPLDEVDPKAAQAVAANEAAAPPAGVKLRPLPLVQREVTALLVRTKQANFGMILMRQINKGVDAQACTPASEVFNLLENFVAPMQQVLLIMTLLICLVSGISILVSMYNSMSERRHEIAVIRALGAGRGTVMSVVLMEAILLALGGGFLGWLAGHAAVASLSGWIADRTGVSIGLFSLAPFPQSVIDSFGESAIIKGLSPELILIPGLMLLAVAVGFLPALAAYRTDVARNLGK